MQTKPADRAASTPTRGAPRGTPTNERRIPRLKARIYGQLLAWATQLSTRIVRWRIVGEEHIHEAIRQGRPIVFAGWHGHNFLTMLSYYARLRRYFKATIIVPESANGLVLDAFGKKTHIHVTKVGAELGPSQWARATVSMIKLIRNGYCALLSPDGPDGPPYEVKPGIAVIAQQTKAVVIPASAAVAGGVKLRRRWDEHLIPLPFSRAVIRFGAPIDTVPSDGPSPAAEELQARIAEALADGAKEAERLCRSGASLARGAGP